MDCDACVVDFESVPSPNYKKSIVYSITAQRIKIRGGVVSRLVSKTFLNRDAYEFVEELYKGTEHYDHIKTKIYDTFCDASVVNTDEMIRKFVKFVNDSGGVWIGHSIDLDMKALYDTDCMYGRTKFFKYDPRGMDEMCTVKEGSVWGRIAKVCTQTCIPIRAPQFWELHKSLNSTHSERFVNICRTIKGPDYQQRHNSIDDVDDLIDVIEFLHLNYKTFYIGTQNIYRAVAPSK